MAHQLNPDLLEIIFATNPDESPQWPTLSEECPQASMYVTGQCSNPACYFCQGRGRRACPTEGKVLELLFETHHGLLIARWSDAQLEGLSEEARFSVCEPRGFLAFHQIGAGPTLLVALLRALPGGKAEVK